MRSLTKTSTRKSCSRKLLMAEDTVEVEYEEVFTSTHRETVTICDDCGREVDSETGVKYYSDRPEMDALDFCGECLDNPDFKNNASSESLHEKNDDYPLSGVSLKGVSVGFTLGFLFTILLF